GWKFSPQGAVPLGQWTHVAGTYDGSTVRLYVNGAQVGTGTSAPGAIAPSANELDIGHDPANPDRAYAGLIDPAQVFNRALSASEIQSIYNAGAAGQFKPLAVDTSTPAAGAVVATAPADFTVRFSEPYDPATVQPADLTVNGAPADSVDTSALDT